MNTWIIPLESDQERLDQALVRLAPEVSRAQWQKRIKHGTVFIDGEALTTPHALVREGSEIVWKEVASSTGNAKPPQILPKLTIIAETKDWLVLDKPVGALVHPTNDSTEPTMVEAILAHDPAIAKVGGEPERPGIIHRLDRDVSGLMVVAKTERAFEELKRQFQQREIKKKYLALVHGEIVKDTGDIRFTLSRSTTRGRMAAHPQEDTSGKAAWTHYTVLERLPGATLLAVEIFSGRTHQIRAHLFALGHPVIGDVLYVKRHTDRRKEAPRLMLQSTDLSFKDPVTQEGKSFHLEADPVFERLITAWSTKKKSS